MAYAHAKDISDGKSSLAAYPDATLKSNIQAKPSLSDVTVFFEDVSKGNQNKAWKAVNDQINGLTTIAGTGKDAVESEKYNIGAVALFSTEEEGAIDTTYENILDLVLAEKQP